VSVLPVAHVDDVDRYVVNRVDTLSGFYGVLQYRGFRDEPSIHIDEIVTKISELEGRLRPDTAGLITSQLRDQAARLTHVYVSGQSLISDTCTEPSLMQCASL
jgi:KUP system potassium uptake protein